MHVRYPGKWDAKRARKLAAGTISTVTAGVAAGDLAPGRIVRWCVIFLGASVVTHLLLDCASAVIRLGLSKRHRG